MYCVIQEIELKKPNKYGERKELRANSFTITYSGVTKTKYTHSYSDERFERPIKKAFKISIHESKRVNGVVTKQQYVITTVDYYDLVDFWIGDCLSEKKLASIAEKLGTTTDYLWELINAKVNPLQEQVILEFQETDEYKTREKNKKIIDLYNNARSTFAKSYDCDSDEYDYCYNVFGELMNKAYLEKVIADYKTRSSYQEYYHSNYNNSDHDYNRNAFFSANTPTNDEKDCFKKFYKFLATKFHPDANLGIDTTREMQILNKLKKEWGV